MTVAASTSTGSHQTYDVEYEEGTSKEQNKTTTGKEEREDEGAARIEQGAAGPFEHNMGGKSFVMALFPQQIVLHFTSHNCRQS